MSVDKTKQAPASPVAPAPLSVKQVKFIVSRCVKRIEWTTGGAAKLRDLILAEMPALAPGETGEPLAKYPYDWRWMRLRGYLQEWLTPHQYDIAKECLDAALQDGLNQPEAVATVETAQVAGKYEGTFAQFTRRAGVLIEEEQAKPLPDNALIAFLCDAIRLAREAVAVMAAQPAGTLTGVVALPNGMGEPCTPGIVEGNPNYKCVSCEARGTPDHLRLRYTYYPLCDKCWDALCDDLIETPAKLTYILDRSTIEKVANDGQLDTERVAFVAADELFHRNPYAAQPVGTPEQVRERYTRAKELLTILGYEEPTPSHSGACGPESGCDAGCMDLAHYGDSITKVVKWLAGEGE